MKELDKVNKTLEKIEVPYDKLAQGRKQAFKSVRMEKKRKHEWRYRLVLATLCLAIVGMAIRFVPTMNDSTKPLQGLGTIEEDQVGPKEFFERLAITEKKNDLTFTLEGVAVEARYMRIDYIIEAPYDISKLEPSKVEIFQNGEQLIGSMRYEGFDKEESKRIKEKRELYLSMEKIESHENFELQITFDDKSQTTFEIPFSLEQPLPEMPLYKVNETVEVGGQAFTVEEVTVSPLHTVVRFTTSPENEMTMYTFDHMMLLDENGKKWATSKNSPAAFGGLTYGEWEVFMENTSSKIPEKMTLVLEDINVLPKGEDYLVVDFAQGKILEQPAVIKEEFAVGQGEISYSISKEQQLNIGVAIDATGKEWTNTSQTVGEDEKGRNYTYYFESMPNPVKLYFYDYPNPLRFKEEILIYE